MGPIQGWDVNDEIAVTGITNPTVFRANCEKWQQDRHIQCTIRAWGVVCQVLRGTFIKHIATIEKDRESAQKHLVGESPHSSFLFSNTLQWEILTILAISYWRYHSIWKKYFSNHKAFCIVKVTETYQATAQLSENWYPRCQFFTPKVLFPVYITGSKIQ